MPNNKILESCNADGIAGAVSDQFYDRLENENIDTDELAECFDVLNLWNNVRLFLKVRLKSLFNFYKLFITTKTK